MLSVAVGTTRENSGNFPVLRFLSQTVILIPDTAPINIYNISCLFVRMRIQLSMYYLRADGLY